MHNATPLNTSLRSYTAGGARGVVDKVDDSKLMQEMGGNFMANETRSSVESPQNYGFTSVVFDSEKDGQGNIKSSAEHFTSFMGGSRSFPVAIMDDRRHRLYKLEKGDTAMFRGRGDKQQLHMTQDGGFWTAPQDKTVRMQLLAEDSDSNSTMQSQGSAGSAASTARVSALATDGGSSSGGAQGGQQQKGQEAKYKDGQKSAMFVEVTKDKTRMGGNQCHMALSDGKTYVHCHTDKKVYVGAEAGKATFAFLVTTSGPCVNALGKIGG
jgi:phage gp45-like